MLALHVQERRVYVPGLAFQVIVSLLEGNDRLLRRDIFPSEVVDSKLDAKGLSQNALYRM